MTNFERLTASPDTLGAFLASIPVASAPWDDAFHKAYCAGCPLEDCEPSCPHQDKRGNPCWWLAQTAEATPSDKSVAPRSRFKGLGEMTDEEIKAFAACVYQAIQSMREAKRQQQQKERIDLSMEHTTNDQIRELQAAINKEKTDRQKRNRATARKVAQLLTESQTTHEDVNEVFSMSRTFLAVHFVEGPPSFLDVP